LYTETFRFTKRPAFGYKVAQENFCEENLALYYFMEWEYKIDSSELTKELFSGRMKY